MDKMRNPNLSYSTRDNLTKSNTMFKYSSYRIYCKIFLYNKSRYRAKRLKSSVDFVSQ